MNVSISDLKTKSFTQKVKLDSLRTVLKKLGQDLTKSKKSETEFQTKNIYWYEGHVFPGKIGPFSPKKWQVFYRNYDRLNNLRLFQSVPSSYDESSKVYLLIENESVKNKFVNSFKTINEESPASSQLISALDGLNTTALSNALIKLNQKSNSARASTAKTDLLKIQDIAVRIKFFESNLLPPPNIPKAFASDEKSKLFTDWHAPIFPDTAKKSYMVYTKVIHGGQIDTIGLRVNKLYHILPTAGLLYSMAKNPEVLLNPDGSFKEAKHFNGFGLMVGLKLFPFGAPINDPKFIVSAKRNPVFDYRKFHFTLGANALQPLQQFYLGAGLDLWSGLSVTGGFHLVYKKQSKLMNNVVDSKHYLDYHNAYLGISLDVPVVVRLITILFR